PTLVEGVAPLSRRKESRQRQLGDVGQLAGEVGEDPVDAVVRCEGDGAPVPRRQPGEQGGEAFQPLVQGAAAQGDGAVPQGGAVAGGLLRQQPFGEAGGAGGHARALRVAASSPISPSNSARAALISRLWWQAAMLSAIKPTATWGDSS